MTNEVMNKELEVGAINDLVEVGENAVEAINSTESSGSNGMLMLGLSVVGAIVGGGIYVFKHKDELKQKRAERKAKKLEKMGWTVTPPQLIEECEAYEEEDLDEDPEE